MHLLASILVCGRLFSCLRAVYIWLMGQSVGGGLGASSSKGENWDSSGITNPAMGWAHRHLLRQGGCCLGAWAPVAQTSLLEWVHVGKLSSFWPCCHFSAGSAFKVPWELLGVKNHMVATVKLGHGFLGKGGVWTKIRKKKIYFVHGKTCHCMEKDRSFWW